MDPISLLALAGLGAGGWALRRSHLRELRRLRAQGSGFDDDAEVALHVARHEARTRGHGWLSPLHVLYGLLQDEAIVEALRASGADPDRLEDRVLAALAAHAQTADVIREGGMVIAYARASAEERGERATCLDLWSTLRFGAQAVALCDEARVDRAAVLFRLFHGEQPADVERLTGDVDIVFRNDHYTTKKFVCEVLEEVFALAPDVAESHMETVHAHGSAVVGRYRAADARARILDVRRRARLQGFPLWVAAQPA